VDLPSSDWGCSGGPSDTVTTLTQGRTYGPAESPCFATATIASELDSRGLSWHYYAAPSNDLGYLWLGYQANSYVYDGPDWANDITLNPQQFITDVKNNKLGAVTWITPNCANSDHSSCRSNTGPSWVASLVNAVGESAFWPTTTIFVMWDEWGGWYDHVPPPYVDYDGLGIRVPLLVISPYAKQGHVSHVQFEQGSILKYIEDTFGLARLAASDKRAHSPVPDAIDYRQQPRAFIPIQSNVPKDHLIRAASDVRAPDRE
jgi:phospholipase C